MSGTSVARDLSAPAPTFPDQCFALMERHAALARQRSGYRGALHQLLACGFHSAGVDLQYLRACTDAPLPAAPQLPGVSDLVGFVEEQDKNAALRRLDHRWQTQSERGDVQGTALCRAASGYERQHMAEVASGADLSEEDELVLSRWQADICYDEEEATLRLVELLDPELALRLKQCSEAQDIPAEPADA
ncbi:hypothetical protein Deipr_2301 (plasmid) [Deinococcus proteolyticus MRP]|uniref:Uncharacterized protein n=1 Tax=Deinococcus proteolyticus (strain ATCC 35074 / DSM 20540 / JCM 6276 / NBRC 101906 / NCIMB 13154 / VKM Ac-1939 / CCM 2703 / MRP) TaxID=693977 RepID=F0RQ67_DEIPM|nr:hypothetical protein [Deinococcus proteolyticus]ADY27426.1 hypothetical protein Deipr_2301 [Deinococcus proteolyticus MRP]